MTGILPMLGIADGKAVDLGIKVLKYHMELGMLLLIIGIFVLAYFNLGARKALGNLAPLGRMSVTNYMAQSFFGFILFYGFGFGLATKMGYAYSFLVGIAICAIQITYSKWWLKRFYYGPAE